MNFEQWFDSLPDSRFENSEHRGMRQEAWQARDAEIAELQAEIDEYKRSFDLRWNASQRAIKRWQAAHPGNDLVWPDHADLCVWLLEQNDHAQSCAVSMVDSAITGEAPTGYALVPLDTFNALYSSVKDEKPSQPTSEEPSHGGLTQCDMHDDESY